MKGKHSNGKGVFGLSPRTNGALLGLAVFGVAAATVHVAERPSDTGTSVAAVKTIPQPRKADATEKSAKKTDERSEVIERARSWKPHSADRVPYSQVRSHEGYRADCSGYVSMTLGLPKPGQNTVGLTSSRYTERIKMSELKKGDLVMDAEGTNTTRHVVIFEKWANSRHTSYWAYEQRGRYGTDYRTRDYGLDAGSEYKAYRPKKLSDA
ncbi:hypothetical protein [Actinomadura monticuli]|uniref:NlpC/P60 family protein n=1 Tax=Actinomadura monticuli TaxID=3097367 RepID=A0ABV4Q9X8_9ACTN